VCHKKVDHLAGTGKSKKKRGEIGGPRGVGGGSTPPTKGKDLSRKVLFDDPGGWDCESKNWSNPPTPPPGRAFFIVSSKTPKLKGKIEIRKIRLLAGFEHKSNAKVPRGKTDGQNSNLQKGGGKKGAKTEWKLGGHTEARPNGAGFWADQGDPKKLVPHIGPKYPVKEIITKQARSCK